MQKYPFDLHRLPLTVATKLASSSMFRVCSDLLRFSAAPSLMLSLSFFFPLLCHSAEFIWWPKKDRTEFLIGFVCRWCYPNSEHCSIIWAGWKKNRRSPPRKKKEEKKEKERESKKKRQSSQKNNNCCTIIQTSYNFATWFGLFVFTSVPLTRLLPLSLTF